MRVFRLDGYSMAVQIMDLMVLIIILYLLDHKTLLNILRYRSQYHFPARALVQWLKLPAWRVGDFRFVLRSGIQFKKIKCSSPDNSLKIWYIGLNFKSCVWRAVSSHSSHHPQDIGLVHFSLWLNKSGLRPYSFYLIVTSLFHLAMYTLLDSLCDAESTEIPSDVIWCCHADPVETLSILN